jgi:hypothetical protein
MGAPELAGRVALKPADLKNRPPRRPRRPIGSGLERFTGSSFFIEKLLLTLLAAGADVFTTSNTP